MRPPPGAVAGRLVCNLVPRVSPLPAPWSERRETLVGSGQVSPRIWEITKKRFGGGAVKCDICLYLKREADEAAEKHFEVQGQISSSRSEHSADPGNNPEYLVVKYKLPYKLP